MSEKTRYSDEELAEFKELIFAKLEKARQDYALYKNAITHGDGNDTEDTSPTFKVLEEGAAYVIQRRSWKTGAATIEIYPVP